MACHVCQGKWIVCVDVFGRQYCPIHAQGWISHIMEALTDADIRKWCEWGGLGGPAAVVVADEGEQDVAEHEARTGHGSPNQDGDGCRMEGPSMLVLSRKRGEAIQIGDIRVVVNWIKGDKVSLGISAPKEINVRRSELPPREQRDDAQ